MTAAERASALNVANAITLTRIVLTPVFATLLIYGERWPAFMVFCVACLTDLADGWVARRYKLVTPLGVFIDPLADKLLSLSALVLLAWQGWVPAWTAVLAGAREVVVVTGYTLLAVVAKLTTVKASALGKAGTGSQMAGLLTVLASAAWPGSPWAREAAWLLGGAVVLNFVAGLQYAAQGLKAYGKGRKRAA